MFSHSRFLFGDIFRFSGYLKSLNMFHRRRKSRKRTRSRSPSSRQNSVSSRDIHHEGSPPKRCKDENDSLQKILQSIERLSNRIDSLEARANQPESIAGTDDDALSIMAGETSGLDIDEPLATEAPFKAATSPVGAPVESIKTPVEPIQASVAPNKAPTESSKTSDEVENSAKSSDDHGLFDPVAKSTSWKPSSSFSKFLDTNFRRKLSYQQSLVIMDDWATPEVDALSAPKLDQQLLNQVPFKVKKFVQERDKEMFNVQRAFLNATGPLCGLHDCIENDSAPTYEEIKVALEQALCLLGSANTQLSILRRQRVLAAINRSRTNLAELPLPNAKSWLFGDDFPSLASKQAELSRGLTNNLAQTTGKSFSRRNNSSLSQSKHRDTFNKYQSTGYSNPSKSQSNYQGPRFKKRAFSSPSPEGTSTRLSECIVSWRTLTSDTQILSIVSGYKISFLKTPFQKSTIYPSIGSGGSPYIRGSERVIAKRGHTKDPFYQRRFLQPPVSCTQKGRIYASGDRRKFFEQVRCKRAFPDGKPQLPKDVAFTRRFYDKYRFKRCLPFCARARDFPKVPSLPLEGNMLPVQGSSIRPVFSPQNFYESSKTCCRLPKEEGHSSPYISGRLSSFGCNCGGSCEKYSAGSESPSVPRFYNKPQEIITDSNTSDNLPGVRNRLNVHEAISPGRKNRQNSRLLSPSARSSKYHIAKPSKFNRSVRVLETSHFASSTSLLSLIIRSDKGPKNEPGVLRRLDCPVTECQSRTCLMVETHPQCKRQSRTPSSAGYNHHNGRLQERLGCSASILSDQWQVVPKRVSRTHQLSRAKGVLSGLENLSQRQVSQNRISATRQHDRHCLHQQQRGYTFPPTHDSGIRDVGLVSGKRHPRDSFSHPRERQRLSGQGVQRIHGYERLEVGPNNYSAFSAELLDRSICESSNQSTRGLHQLETRPGSHPHRRLHDKLGYSTGLCLPPLQSDIENPDEVNNRPNGTNSRGSSLASSALVAGSAISQCCSRTVQPC